MLKTPMPTQHELEMVTLEELVPKDHLLRQIDAAVDFEFLRAKVAHLYCADNGRPALDPVVMFKLLFIGYLFGVRSERQLMREVQVNVAYRWFARFRLTDKVPDASTFSQNRRRRFTDTTVYQEIFDEIRAAGDQARAGRRSGAVHGQHAPEGEREQRQVRCGEAGADAGRLHGGIERGSGCGPGRAWQEAAGSRRR
ncbi:hypothetical protein DO61_2254 [Burkholderia mallei]|nr:hypothetical protein DO61_2254 [Burkholderia mallei]